MAEEKEYDWHLIPRYKLGAMNNGDVIGLNIEKNSIYLAKYSDEYFAGYSKCPHAGGDLTESRINPHGEIICPLHNYKFKLKNGQMDNQEYCITTYPIKSTIEGDLMIGFVKKKGWFF